jgi:hypothetical protein
MPVSRHGDDREGAVIDQTAVTIMADVRPERVGELKAVLAEVQMDPGANSLLPFAAFPGLHFARFVVLDPATDLDGRSLPPSLVFLSDVDGPVGSYLKSLVTRFGPGVDRIFAHCEGYPTGRDVTPARRLAYLRAHMKQAEAVYVNTVGRTVRQVHEEARLREQIERFLDESRGRLAGAGPVAIHRAIRTFVAGDPSLAWPLKPAPGPGPRWWLRQLARFAPVALPLLLLSPVLIVAAPFYLFALRLHERRDTAPDVRPDPARVRALAALEDHLVHNQFTAVGFVKPGALRRWTTIAMLWLLNAGVRLLFNRGSLSGITTIHFARWMFINGRRRVVFASNYDGSLESYMDDFINRVAWGLNAVFSNGLAYPRTRWLILGGARNEQAYKHFLRVHQIPTQVWYSAYGRLSAVNIENNAAIRAGLSARLDAPAAAAWLRRF